MPHSKHKNNFKIVFMVLALLILLFSLVPNELIHELNPTSWKQGEIPIAYERMVQNFSIHDSLAENKAKLLNEIEEYDFEQEIFHEEILSTVNGYFTDNNIIITKVIFSEISAVAYNEEEIVDISAAAAVSVDVIVEFVASFDNVLNLIDTIKRSKQNVGLSNIRLLSIDESDFMGVVELRFYAMPLNEVSYEDAY